MPLDKKILAETIAAQQEKIPFSGTLYVRENAEILVAQGYGFANRAEEIPNTVQTRFGIASGAKTFTGVAICQLVDRGLLTFDTRLADCCAVSFPNFDPQISVHHLLSHSAGNPDYFDEEVMDDYEALWLERPMYSMRTARDFLPLFAHLPMKFKPGEKWSYSNAGYIVLGLIVEHVTGMPFPHYVEENIFRVCEMNSSGYFSMDSLPKGSAHGYIPLENGGWKTNIYSIPIIGGPDGGVFTSAPDLSKFWDALLAGQLVKPVTLERMFTPHYQTNAQSGESFYGYGFWLSRQNNEPLACYMLGEDPGVAFLSAYYPGKKILFSLLGNIIDPAWEMFDCIKELIKAA